MAEARPSSRNLKSRQSPRTPASYRSRRRGAVGAQLRPPSSPIDLGEAMAKDNVEDDAYETVYVHADNATIEAPFPVKTKTGHKYKPGLPGMLAICRFQVGEDLAADCSG